MFINNYCLFYTCVILFCHVGEGPVPTALVWFCILIFKSLYIFSHKPEAMNSPVYIHVHVYTCEMILI